MLWLFVPVIVVQAVCVYQCYANKIDNVRTQEKMKCVQREIEMKSKFDSVLRSFEQEYK